MTQSNFSPFNDDFARLVSLAASSMSKWCCWTAAVAAMSLGSVAADTVTLNSGGQMTGKVREVDSAKNPYILVQVDSELSVALPKANSRLVVSDEKLQEYRQRVVRAGLDGQAHYELASWCKENGLLQQRQYHLLRTIDLIPDHANARAALRYVERDGKWILYEEWRRSQGLVKDRKGHWVLPEVITWRSSSDENDKTAKRWIKTIKQLLAKILRGDNEAMEELIAISDPLASQAMAKELVDSQSKGTAWRPVRMVWLKKLMEFRTGPAVEAIVKTGLLEPDDVVREEALKWLQTNETGSAIATYMPWLKSNSPKQVKAAARALSYFPNPEAAFAYIDALVTIEKKAQQVGGGTQAGFDNTGSGGFSQGSKQVVVNKPHRHPEVLQLLRAIAPDVDFGYDKSAWKQYFAELRSPPRSDLRRDS
ncbi:HEAT repeat domain-containing protein [Rhodopirellula halodulae]|uniref:HEAT repeat domain-containing protein n=1 Tax=Rhodopirellula halodulae TaxID=2894198 RepID=UPI001E542230|nr:HEAT repeat domain-containing protein [Rhodopirellula sp. JC737]MCC9657656.1 HEAT repeat domain-containing protein [Rhodopirellula sp. JC737]